MAVVFCEVALPDHISEFSGSTQQDVEECKRFWQSAYLQPQGESTLVCAEITQRLSKHSMAVSSKHSNSKLVASTVYRYVNPPVEDKQRERNLAERREESRKRFCMQQQMMREKDQPRRDLLAEMACKSLLDREQREMESARRLDLHLCQELSAEIAAFEDSRNISSKVEKGDDCAFCVQSKKIRFRPDAEANSSK